ncbi:MAG: hypothetical protein JWQ72_2596 [Polaromonas sp.]|nr:hypothetical protein [Polaromonas sp.]
MRLHTVLLTATLALACASAGAQAMKPGLWEINSKLGGSPEMDKAMAQMQQQLASMPPAQRKQMEDMMARQGVGMSAGANGGMAAKMCLTKEMADRQQMPMQQQGNCTTSTSDKTASGMKMKFTCTNPPSSGEGQFTFTGDSAYTMKMTVNSSAQGAPRTTTIDASGKWLTADCGSIKPMAIPAGK